MCRCWFCLLNSCVFSKLMCIWISLLKCRFDSLGLWFSWVPACLQCRPGVRALPGVGVQSKVPGSNFWYFCVSGQAHPLRCYYSPTFLSHITAPSGSHWGSLAYLDLDVKNASQRWRQKSPGGWRNHWEKGGDSHQNAAYQKQGRQQGLEGKGK